jgi:hypothetical protein
MKPLLNLRRARRRSLSLLLIAAAVTAGCGGSDQASNTPTTSKSTTPTVPKSHPKPAVVSCDDFGLLGGHTRVGRCQYDPDTVFRVVNRGHALDMKQYVARVGRIQTISGPLVGDSLVKSRPDGIWISVALRITNKLRNPAHFGSPMQAELYLGDDVYEEDQPGEQSYAGSFINRPVIDPEETQPGEVLFDVPKAKLHSLKRNAGLSLLDFTSAQQFGRAMPGVPVGFVRLYG